MYNPTQTYVPAQNNTGYNPYQQPYPSYQQTVPIQQPLQIQNGGFITAPSEEYARNYPVAQGTRVVFKDENLPYIYIKTVSFSLTDPPLFEKYERIEEKPAPAESAPNKALDDIAATIAELKRDVSSLKSEIERRNPTDKKRG